MSRTDQQRIRRLVLLRLTHRIRFDVVTVVLRTDSNPVVQHHQAMR